MIFPEKYTQFMKDFLYENYPAWQDSFLALPERGIRVNELKINPDTFRKLWQEYGDNSELEPIPWIHNGFHVRDTSVFSAHPFYQAGLYYIQEPSAMTPAEILPVSPGDYILDLCAAPGGKTTELLSKLRGSGLLYANDISASRANALRKNVEIAGAANAYITAESPEKLSAVFPLYFDKILVDAPCSGEGMFRRKPEMISDWEEKGPDYYAPIQQEILNRALKMLAPGGMIVYSTCTFSELENEENVRILLEKNPDMELCEIPDFPGFLGSRFSNLKGCIRVMPHRMRGEGQFVCLLKKKGSRSDKKPSLPIDSNHTVYERDGKVYLLPCGHMPRPGIRYLMTGLHVGTVHADRLNPSQALAQALHRDEWTRTLNLRVRDPRLIKYLKGESIDCSDDEIRIGKASVSELFSVSLSDLSCNSKQKERKNLQRNRNGKKTGNDKAKFKEQNCPLYTGDILILAEGFPIGFGAENRGMIKNKRNPGWRIP